MSRKNQTPKPLVSTLTLLITGLLCLPIMAEERETILLLKDDAVCPQPRINLPTQIVESAVDGEDIAIEGDSLEAQGANQVVISGGAQIVQGKRGVFADSITYNRDDYSALAEGDVRFYTEGGDLLTTESMELEVDTFIGQAGATKMYLSDREPAAKLVGKNYNEDYSFFAPLTNRIVSATQASDEAAEDLEKGLVRSQTRVSADSVDIEGQTFQRLKNAEFTRCPEGNSDVRITGEEVELDLATGLANAKGVKLLFKGVPILYAPRMTFPIGDQRLSGFLAPSIGQDDLSGTVLSMPYYFNLAPTYDATLRPTWHSERGTQLYGEFRYMSEKSDGDLKLEYMPEDELYNGEARHAFSFDHQQRISDRWNARVDLQDVSDVDYLSDFNNDVDVTGSAYLPQTGELIYSSSLLSLNASVRSFEVVNQSSANNKPYDRLPQITMSLHPEQFGPIELGLDAEYISFDHDNAQKLTGTRIRTTPWVGMPYEPIYGFLKPKIALPSVSYSLDNATTGDSSPSASVPAFYVDSGLFFERDIGSEKTALVQTLEPRIMYVNVQEKDQGDFPLFDTGNGTVSSYNYLFREERFFGGDRIGDDHHIALGVTTRIIDDETGDERLQASIGQMVYLDDRVVGLNAESEPETADFSDIFADVRAEVVEDLDVNSFLRWDQDDGEVSNWNLGIKYDDDHRREAAVDYYFTRGATATAEDREDLRLQLDWPLTPQWQVTADQRYSITDSEVRSSSLGLIYDSCCWALGVSFNRNLQSDGEYRESVMATLEFDGIGHVSANQSGN